MLESSKLNVLSLYRSGPYGLHDRPYYIKLKKFCDPTCNELSPWNSYPMNDFFSSLSPSSIWLIAGALLIIIEISLFSGIGFLFTGLGAITVGAGLILGWIDSLPGQFIIFFLSTAFWTAILWKPLKSFIAGKESGFDDMVGSTAVVFGQSIEKGKMGEVKWSGTIMKCKFDPEAEELEMIAPETEVIISAVSKGILIIREKSVDG